MTIENQELERMALAGELAGQLRHDVGSFVYHLNLHLELLEALPNHQPDWTAIKREGTRLGQMLREWDEVRGRPSQPAKINLNHLVRQVVKQIHRKGFRSKVELRLPSTPIPLMARSGEVRRLIQLLLRQAIAHSRAADETDWSLLVETSAEPAVRLILRGVSAGGVQAMLDEEAEIAPSLVSKTCRSLAQRLNVTLRSEPEPGGKAAIIVEFPGQFATEGGR